MFDVEAAKKAGYDDAEIASFLAQQNNMDINGARESGYGDSEIIGFLTSQETPQPAAQTPESPSGFTRGMMDPINASAQLLEQSLPESWSKNVNKFNNWLVDQGLPLQQMPPGGFDQYTRENEQRYQQARQASGDTGLDVPRLLGNVASPTNLAIASKIPQMASLGGRMLAGAAGGSLMGATSAPVTEGDFWTEKGRQATIGGITGGVMPAVTGALSRIIKPRSSPEVQSLMKEGVTPTPGQALGGGFQRTEEALTSMPIVGDAIKAGQTRAIGQFNTAAINRALAPIGEKLPKNVEPGRRAITYVGEKLSKAYDDLLPNLRGELDKGLMGEITQLKKAAVSMPDTTKSQFNRILQNEVLDRFTSSGLANGRTLKNIEGKLGEIAKGYAKSADYDQRTLGGAIQELQAGLRRMVERANPDYKTELQAVNKGWSSFLRLQNAAGRVGAQEGVFTPAQLRSATRAMDPTRNKSAFAKGRAPMQDIAEAGTNVLSQKVPDSGTPLRSLVNLGALYGGYAVHPGTAAAAGAGVLPYTPWGQKAASSLLASRPAMAAPIAEGVRKASSLLNLGAVPYMQGLLAPGQQ